MKGYSPRDGVWHSPHTTVGGMLDKHEGGGDFGWNAARSRNISADMQYVLWLMRDIWPAERLLEEMEVGH